MVQRLPRHQLLKMFLIVAGGLQAGAECHAAEPTAESRALDYLAREVPRWSSTNRCYSCHNNGDAARALFLAKQQARQVPEAAFADTARWLAQPEKWDHNGGEGPFSDKKLARLQFAAALAAALDAKVLADDQPLKTAARQVAELQDADGSWQVDAGGMVGSPTTHGPVLATVLAVRTLARADPITHRQAIARARRWLTQYQPMTVLDAAALLLDDAGKGPRTDCLELIRKGMAADGGWGPYVTASPEPFDTALVLLALERFRDSPGVESMIQKGRSYLISQQLPAGSWKETTRPSGAESYAQRISTSGWATLALLMTERRMASRSTSPEP